jgi:ATP-binding cassette subfamily B protein
VGWPHVLLLLLWVLVALGLGWCHWRQSHAWIDTYREMTNGLVEQMVGHRTRLAQEDRAHWHDGEDQMLDHYVLLSAKLDRLATQLQALIPRGWSVMGLAGVCYVIMVTQSSAAQLAISLGGMLLALQALTRLVNGMQSLISATLAWTQVGPLFQAASRASEPSLLNVVWFAEGREPAEAGRPVVTARELSFRYRHQGREVLRECNLQVWSGDRLLLEGPSGGGKSTLAAVLAGLRTPESGILLLWGYDRHTMGSAAWRRRVVMVPQFHENHVLSATFAFNLLMGRRWPPRPEDLAEAEAVCRELGLGDLLDRMPSGMQQMVGESGWQLSHGECSRLYIARAILQQADIIILDESFGALDPENLQRALRCVLQRASTLLVIAHP